MMYVYSNWKIDLEAVNGKVSIVDRNSAKTRKLEQHDSKQNRFGSKSKPLNEESGSTRYCRSLIQAISLGKTGSGRPLAPFSANIWQRIPPERRSRARSKRPEFVNPAWSSGQTAVKPDECKLVSRRGIGQLKPWERNSSGKVRRLTSDGEGGVGIRPLLTRRNTRRAIDESDLPRGIYDERRGERNTGRGGEVNRCPVSRVTCTVLCVHTCVCMRVCVWESPW